MLVLAAEPVFANSSTGPVTILVQLEKQLHLAGYEVNVLNAGVSGDTTAGGLARIEWLLAAHPEIVVVELGGNDALRGLDSARTYANLDKILTRLEEAGCRVILTGIKAPRNLGYEYYTKFDQIYYDLAKQHDVLFYPFFLEGVATDPALNQADGIHPNVAGVQRIVAGLYPLVSLALDELRLSEKTD